jgi:predicted RNA-binding protein
VADKVEQDAIESALKQHNLDALVEDVYVLSEITGDSKKFHGIFVKIDSQERVSVELIGGEYPTRFKGNALP